MRALVFYSTLVLWVALQSGCGYRALYGSSSSEQLSVQVGQVLVPEVLAAQAAASGARAELSAAGRFSQGSQGREGRRLVIDVLRVDEASRGIHMQPGSSQPSAAGMSVAVTVRGRVFSVGAQEPDVDTGDVRRTVQLAGDSDPRADSAAYDQAVRDAAERAGRATARAAIGIPEPADEVP